MESQRDGELEPFLQSTYHTQLCIKVPGERIIVYQVVHDKPVKIRVDLRKRDRYLCVGSSRTEFVECSLSDIGGVSVLCSSVFDLSVSYFSLSRSAL